MPFCPAGHRSGTADWCDVCGRAVGAPPPPYDAPDARCTVCGSARPGRFCDECGADAALPAATALITTDAEWFAHVCSRVGDPVRALAVPDIPPRRIRLEHDRVLIGRLSRRNPRPPDLDLTGDPGVSARHAMLVADQHGGWCVIDLGSRNGTAVGGRADHGAAPTGPDDSGGWSGSTIAADTGRIPAHTPVPLPPGRVVRLGLWTAVRIEPLP